MDTTSNYQQINISRGTLKKKDLFKLPNILCYIRILMIPLFIILFCKELYWQSALVAVLASVTDVIDGYIARTFNMKTDWGMFLDPLADKLMQLAMLICSIFKAPWLLILVVIFLIKEFTMLFYGIFVYRKGRNLDGSIWCGKLCTVVLDLSLFYIIGAPECYLTTSAVATIICICTIFLMMSFIIYMKEYVKLYQTTKVIVK